MSRHVLPLAIPSAMLTLVSLADAVDVVVRVTPRAARSAVIGTVALADGRTALAVRLRAPPVDGAANAALTALLAEALGARRSDIAIIAGDSSRVKRLRVTGDPVALAARLQALV